MTDNNPLVQTAILESGAVWRVTFGASKGNVLDAALVAELTALFRKAALDRHLKAIILEGQGRHFSFGASVEEHLPEHVASMLHGFHNLFHAIFDASVVTIAVIRGACLGGGLELATACHRIYATADSTLGQPEISLGVFAPVASILLPERVGRAHAEDLLLSGQTIDGETALRIGLVDGLAVDPMSDALAYARDRLLAHSASSLRLAVRAAREGLIYRFNQEIARLEQLYLETLMRTKDAGEGLNAFIDKRKPVWSNS
ncbi:MAG: enoyl-CoA hydratase/isomerase family protein [Vicinamibacteria bacterium]